MSNVADKLAKKSPRQPRPAKQVRLKLVYLNLGSTVLVSLLIGLVLGVLSIVIAIVAWAVFTQIGAFDQLDTFVAGAGAGSGIDLKAFFSFSRVIGLSAALGLINVIGVTIFGTMCALVYNLIVKATGGLFVGFTNN
jgi:hypothetical protein